MDDFSHPSGCATNCNSNINFAIFPTIRNSRKHRFLCSQLNKIKRKNFAPTALGMNFSLDGSCGADKKPLEENYII